MKYAVDVALIFLIHYYSIFPAGVADAAISRCETQGKKRKISERPKWSDVDIHG